MGEVADYHMALAINDIFPDGIIRDHKNFTVWFTRDNRSLKITDMSTEHINHSINMIERSDWRVGYLDNLEAELTKRHLYGI
jgi:hypothetical protein